MKCVQSDAWRQPSGKRAERLELPVKSWRRFKICCLHKNFVFRAVVGLYRLRLFLCSFVKSNLLIKIWKIGMMCQVFSTTCGIAGVKKSAPEPLPMLRADGFIFGISG